MSLRLIFMGTPQFSVPVLDALVAAGHTIVAAYSQPPRPGGRGLVAMVSPVQRRAEDFGIPVLTPASFKADADRMQFQNLDADAAVVVAYGLLLPLPVLAATRLGCFNVHASLLPRWRGAAPIQRAIMAGDTRSGVTIMRMEQGLDTGPMCLHRSLAITPDMTAAQLHDALSGLGAAAMCEALELLSRGQLKETPQPTDGITYAAKIDKREAHITFDAAAEIVTNHIHGLSPFPGAWFEVSRDGITERIKVLAAKAVPTLDPTPNPKDAVQQMQPGQVIDGFPTIACATGAVQLLTLQRAGKKPVAAGEFMRGFRLPIGTALT